MRSPHAFSAIICGAVVAMATLTIRAQPQLGTNTKFASGQNVVPVYEGWIPNADGTASMVFGYFNRNWEEEPVIAIGPTNNIEPGGPDRGQPTYFLPRRQRSLFKVQVPKDWGLKDVIWTLTVAGRTEKAYGSLLPVEEINERMFLAGGGLSPAIEDPNQPPSVKVEPIGAVATSRPLALTALVTDDGLPKPRVAPPPQAPGPGGVTRQANSSGFGSRGLTVRWFVYRGPAKVIFDPAEPVRVTDGKAAVTARFTQPGTYWLRAVANDGRLSMPTDVTVTVSGSPSARLLPWLDLFNQLRALAD